MIWPWSASPLEAELAAERAAHAETRAALEAERAALRTLMEQVTKAALDRPAPAPAEPDPPLPAFPRAVTLAINGRAPKAAKLHRAALRQWALERMRAGDEPGAVAGAIADGDADAELLIAQEEV